MVYDLTSGSTFRTREVLRKSFHRFGTHVATHQIRVLLICSVVITSLFYPALAIYSSSQPRFLARFTSQILNSLPGAAGTEHHDLAHLWTPHAHDALLAREDAVARARCGMELTLRAERILAHGAGAPHARGALTADLLLSMLRLEERLSGALVENGVQCLKAPDGERCLVVSPLAFWRHSEDAVRGDTDIVHTLSLANNVSYAGVYITPQMVLAGRELDESDPTEMTVDYAKFFALTYFFPETDCLGTEGHATWLRILSQVADNSMDIVVQPQEPQLIALQYDPHAADLGHSALTSLLYLTYIIFFVWFSGVMRRLHTVHSRVGLAFTGLVEILASMITSLSVCALAGFKITMVPWGFFPVIIVFVGAENMFSLVDAVVKTSIALPVKERIAEGLSRAGASNTLKVVSYNTILGLIASAAPGAIRQFCALAVVVLVAHWFLVHTFFIAVLSIDIQRLELDELLRQDATRSSSPSPIEKKSAKHPQQPKLRSRLINVLQGRASRNLSLLLLLAITGALYHATYPAVPITDSPPPALTREQQARILRQPFNETRSPAWNTWQALNPTRDALIHVRLEAPTIVHFRPASTTSAASQQQQQQLLQRRLGSRALRQVAWQLKFIVGPIAATTFMLYGLLLYLLKDSELVAQRHRTEAATPESADDAHRALHEAGVSFGTLPRAFASDLELAAASRDGTVIAAAGLHDEVVVWNKNTGASMALSVIDGPENVSPRSRAAGAIVSALAVSPDGRFCAVGTSRGMVVMWSLGDGKPHALPRLSHSHASAVTSLFLVPAGARAPRQSPRMSPTSAGGNAPVPIVAATHADGSVFKWEFEPFPSATSITSLAKPGSVLKSSLIQLSTDECLAAFFLEDGSLEMYGVGLPPSSLLHEVHVHPSTTADPVTAVDACTFWFSGVQRCIIAAATSCGRVSLWDGTSSGECIGILPDRLGGAPGRLRVIPVPRDTCAECEEPLGDILTLAVSRADILAVYRAYNPSLPRRCRCLRRGGVSAGLISWQSPFDVVVNGADGRHRAGSAASTSATSAYGASSPLLRSRANSSTELAALAAFPVSAHGVHSRRASDKDATARRMLMDGIGGTSFFGGGSGGSEEEYEQHPFFGGSFRAAPAGSVWADVVLERTASERLERGQWDVLGSRVVGVRRGARHGPAHHTPGRKPNGALNLEPDRGLSIAALERWETWVYEPGAAGPRIVPLAALRHAEEPSPSRKRRVSGELYTSDVPRLPFTRVSAFVGGRTFALAGLGNTLGVIAWPVGGTRGRSDSS